MKDEKNKKHDKDAKGKDTKGKDGEKSKKKSKNYNYFEALESLTNYSVQAAELLHSILKNYDPTKLEDQMIKMHDIEHSADIAKHDMMKHLLKEFLPPIDREDISELAQEIDNVTDTVEDVLMQLYMYNIQTIRKESVEFSENIVICCSALKKAMSDFQNYKKSTIVTENIINVNNLEEVGDRLYTRSMRELYATSTDAIEIMTWTKNFNALEKCCDACEEVADAMESIIMKNS